MVNGIKPAVSARPRRIASLLILLDGRAIDDMIADAQINERDLPRRVWFAARIHDRCRDLWWRRPIITTNQRFKDQYINGISEGIGHMMAERGELPVAPIERAHASRTTSTGRTLVAVGQ